MRRPLTSRQLGLGQRRSSGALDPYAVRSQQGVAGEPDQVYRSQGRGVAPKWETLAAPPQPGLELIAVKTAANSATLDFTEFDATKYSSYLFVLESIIPDTDGAAPYVRTSSNNGSSYDEGASDYSWGYMEPNTSIVVADSADSEVTLSAGVGSDANEVGVFLSLTLYAPDRSQYTVVSWQGGWVNGSNVALPLYGTGRRLSAADVDAIRFLFSSGNIESGTIRMYGLQKAVPA